MCVFFKTLTPLPGRCLHPIWGDKNLKRIIIMHCDAEFAEEACGCRGGASQLVWMVKKISGRRIHYAKKSGRPFRQREQHMLMHSGLSYSESHKEIQLIQSGCSESIV